MMEILERRSCRPRLLVSMPSMKTCPSGSVSRNSDVISDDLPAPVRPTIPICRHRKKTIRFSIQWWNWLPTTRLPSRRPTFKTRLNFKTRLGFKMLNFGNHGNLKTSNLQDAS